MNTKDCEKALADLYPDVTVTGIERLTGGVSADVYRLDVLLADGATSCVVLRSHGETHSGHGPELEHGLLRSLHDKGLPVPRSLKVDVSGQVLADPYLIMEFVEGATGVPADQVRECVDKMATTLAAIHATSIESLPELPIRTDPIPEVFDFLRVGEEWSDLTDYLRTLSETAYTGEHCLLHGDYWPENVLWQDSEISSVLDWEDAAVGDPLSDVASCRVELRYKYGKPVMDWFLQSYTAYRPVDTRRLALWQVYVSSAADRYMGEWGLAADLEAHMRKEALASIKEAGDELMGLV